MKKILVVDNDVFILEFMKDLLSKEGHEIVCAEDGLSALDVLHSNLPDIIFTDLVMPNIDGNKLCRIVRDMERLSHVHIVVLSSILPEEGLEVGQLGVSAYITKGSFDEMSQHILRVLKQLDIAGPRRPSDEIIGIEQGRPRVITEELLSRTRHLEIILESMSEGILEITSKGRIIYANKAALLLFHLHEEKLLGAPLVEFFNRHDRPLVAGVLEKLDEMPIALGEEFGINLNEYQITLNIIPVRANGRTAIVIVNDVTEKKRLEAETMRSAHLASLGELSAGVAHEINNPINGIINYAEILKDRCMEEGRDPEIPVRIIKESERIAHIVSNLLSFARNRRENPSPAHVRDLFSGVLDLMEKGIGEDGIELAVEIPEELPFVNVRSEEIQQVFLNILSNARYALNQRFTGYHKSKILEITGRAVEIEGGSYVRVIFRDSGKGIAKDILPRICNPFFTTKPRGDGVGLGLSISHGIIKRHGGRLWFESIEGQYTEAVVDLPYAI